MRFGWPGWFANRRRSDGCDGARRTTAVSQFRHQLTPPQAVAIAPDRVVPFRYLKVHNGVGDGDGTFNLLDRRRTVVTGNVRDTYVAAIQHDLVALGESDTLVGVVRRPTGWFNATVEENHPELGPPDVLLDEFQRTHEDLKAPGMCDSGAHNAVWEEIDFESRYREYLRDDPDAGEAFGELAGRLRGGEDLVLVCYENTDEKRCHRTVLRDELRDRL